MFRVNCTTGSACPRSLYGRYRTTGRAGLRFPNDPASVQAAAILPRFHGAAWARSGFGQQLPALVSVVIR